MRLRDVVKAELIGLEIEVIDSPNPYLKGLHGTIVDETRNTLTIRDRNTEKRLIKNQITLTTLINNKKISIKGELLVGRPEERLKKRVKL